MPLPGNFCFLIPAIILAFCTPAVFVPSKLVPFIFYIATAFIIGLSGVLWAQFMSANFLSRNPWAVDSLLNPKLAKFAGGLLLLFSLGLLFALGTSSALIYMRLIKSS